MIIREMTIKDYEKVQNLWKSVKGFAIRSMDDSEEGVLKFLKRNPGLSVVAEKDGCIVGTILSGHDGRRGCFYHVCVHEAFREMGIGSRMAAHALKELQREGINKVCLIAFKKNEVGNMFWKQKAWTYREDLNYYDFTLNEHNLTIFNS